MSDYELDQVLLAQRDRARDIAVILEAQVAQVAEIHRRMGACECGGCGTGNPLCAECGLDWPCDTARAIDIGGAS